MHVLESVSLMICAASLFDVHPLQVLVDPAALMHVLGTKMDYVEDRLK